MSRRMIRILVVVLMGSLWSATLWAQPAKVRRAPNFSLPDWQNHWVKLSDFPGKVIVLEFMQTRCPYCHGSASILEELYQKYQGQGLVVISVSHDPNKEKDIEPFVKQYGLTYPILIGDLAIAVRYIGITRQDPSFAIPYVFLIDRQGNIAGEYIHDRDVDFFLNEKENLEKEITRLLKQSPPPAARRSAKR